MNLSQYSSITRPTLLVDRARVERNIQRMVDKAQQSGARLRPHFKTHQSADIGEWFRARGIESIAVSSLGMAEYFSRYGWSDILVAFPFNPREINVLNRIAASMKLHILLDEPAAIEALSSMLKTPIGVWIDIDAGYARTGIPADDEHEILALADQIESTPMLSLVGLYEHAGHTYYARRTELVRQRFLAGVSKLHQLRRRLAESGHSSIQIGAGDTPGCSLVADFAGLDEIHPGNFAFCDLTQVQLGTCTLDDIGVAVACPVVSVYAERREVAIHGGAVHLSKERLAQGTGESHFGKAIALHEGGWDPREAIGEVVSVSQEVGIIRVAEDRLSSIHVGDLVGVLPVHSCLAASALDQFVTTDGKLLDSM